MFAQDPITIKLTEKEGLPDVEFYDILEDNESFIWLAADKGLYRFDGKEYVSYTNKNKRGLSVFGLKQDDKNQLWCNNISGQFFFIKNNSLELFLDLKNELKGELAEFAFLGNKLYIFSTTVVFSVDMVTKERKKVILPSQNKVSVIRAPYKQNDIIYFAGDNVVYTITKSEKIEILKPQIAIFGSNFFPKFFSYHDEFYFLIYDNIFNKNQFFIKHDDDFVAIEFPKELKNTKIISILENKEDLWFCTSNGIVILNKSKKKFVLKEVIFKNDFITKCIIDKNETVWISTLNNGIFIVPSLNIKSYKNVVNNEVISAVEKITPSNIAIGTTKGDLFLLDLKTGIKDKIEIKNKRKISSLLFLEKEKTLLISTEESGYSYHLNSKKLSSLQSLNNAKDLQQIGSSNTIVYAGFDRATVLNFENNALQKIKDLNYSRAYRSFSDNENHEIFVSYVDNLVVYDSVFKGEIVQYNNKSITAKDICKTNNGIVWIATFSEGILGYENNKFVKKIDLKNGLKSLIIQEIKADKNDVWIVTDKGIQVFSSYSNRFKPSLLNTKTPIGNTKGLIINDKNILLISQEGVFEIEKHTKQKAYFPKEIYYKTIIINEKDTLVLNNYNLSYDKNRIKISFHTNGYFPEDELQFEYRMVGLSDQWVPIEKNVNIVNFTSLPAKTYIFEIKAKNSNQKSFLSQKIQFHINTPYWKKWWFIASLILVAFGLMILFYRNKLAVKEKEKELALRNAKFENELALLKLENLKSQMNPHFIFNALNSIQEYIVLNQKNLASSYLAKFADLIRAYLNHSSKGYISLQEEVECLTIYLQLEKLRFEEKFSYEIDNLGINQDIKIPTMLIQPYVENAIKHGLLHKKEDRRLVITFDFVTNGNMLSCCVLDNGVGRAKASEFRNKKHESFATKATQNRLELLNFGKERKIGVTVTDLFNDNKEACGTKVILLIPILK